MTPTFSKEATAWCSAVLMAVGGLFFCLFFSNGGLPTDEIYGRWTDACPCKIPCPCWKTQKSSAKSCVNFQVFRIRAGLSDGLSMAGSIFVLESKPQREGEAPTPMILFVEPVDTQRQRAIAAIVKRLGFDSPRVVPAKISYHATRDTQSVSLGGILWYQITFDPNRVLASEVSENLYPWLFNGRQGVVLSVVSLPHSGHAVEYSGTNALSADFRLRMAGNEREPDNLPESNPGALNLQSACAAPESKDSRFARHNPVLRDNCGPFPKTR